MNKRTTASWLTIGRNTALEIDSSDLADGAYRMIGGNDDWSVEVRIPVAGANRREVDPFDGVAGFKPTPGQPWYFNVCRQRVREDSRHTMSFSPTFGGFQKPERFARLYCGDPATQEER